MEDFQEVKSRRDPDTSNNNNNYKRGQKHRGGFKEGHRGGQHYQKKQQPHHDDVEMKETPVVTSPVNTPSPSTQQPVKVQEEEKKGGDHQNRNKQPHNNRGPKKVKSHNPSTEEGFTGEPETWFDDIQFKKQIT